MLQIRSTQSLYRYHLRRNVFLCIFKSHNPNHHSPTLLTHCYDLLQNNQTGWKNGSQKQTVEPLELSYLLGIAGGCLAAFLILLCLCIYAIRTRKCCFRSKYHLTNLIHIISTQRGTFLQIFPAFFIAIISFLFPTDRNNYKTSEKDRWVETFQLFSSGDSE